MEKIVGPETQLAQIVDISKPQKILSEAKRVFKANYPKTDFKRVEKPFLLTKRLYDGRFPGYLACAVDYHNYAHSVAVFESVSCLLDGCVISGLAIEPEIAAETLIAALLHDTGYLREEGDTAGTGAQYTQVHVDRSAAFARRETEAFGLEGESAERIARMILGTDLARSWKDLYFASEGERLGAEVLAAADLLGQMADRAYLEKLLFLYYEFREAGIGGYESAFDILRKTAAFYESTKARLDGSLGRVSRKSREHFRERLGVDRDLYREAVERQMAYLDSIIADGKTNFRNKLKRIDWEKAEVRGA
jgi:hypothetical protein